MARFFGCNLDKKKQLNRTVLSWLRYSRRRWRSRAHLKRVRDRAAAFTAVTSVHGPSLNRTPLQSR